MPDTLFDKLVRQEIPSRIVWEDKHYLAFLTPFPNTPGLTVVIPKTNEGDYVFGLSDAQYSGLMIATRTVAKILEKAFSINRVALVFEGTGVAYVHAKLMPLHGPLADETDLWPGEHEFVEEYRGYLTTLEGPAMSDERLDEIQAKIIAAQNS